MDIRRCLILILISGDASTGCRATYGLQTVRLVMADAKFFIGRK
jgi:hypothetical protein